MYCTNCGRSDIPEDAVACPTCGSGALATGEPAGREQLSTASEGASPADQASEQGQPAPPAVSGAQAGLQAAASSSPPPRRPISTRTLIIGGGAAAVVVAILLFLLVFNQGDKASANIFDPSKADGLAAAAIIGVRDLPGSGWDLSEVDIFDDVGDLANTPACAAVKAETKPTEDKLSAKRAGRAQRQYSIDTPGFQPDRSVEVQVTIYRDGKSVKEALALLGSAYVSDEALRCYEEAARDQGVPSASVKKAAPSTSPPKGGAAIAIEIQLQIPGLQPITQRLESYAWTYGNAQGEVTIMGVPPDVTSAFVSAIIAKADARLKQAGTADPPAPEPIVRRSPTAAATAQASSRTVTPQPTAAQATASPATPAATVSGGGAGALTKLGGLNSFRSTLKISGSGALLSNAFAGLGPSSGSGLEFEVTGAYVKPDRGQQSVKLGPLSINIVTIGRQQWTGFGGSFATPETGTWDLSDYSLAASFWDDALVDDLSALRCTGSRETVNGIPTRSCGIDQSAFNQLRDLLGGIATNPSSGIREFGNLAFQIWIAEPGGYVVRLRMDASGKDVSGANFTMKIELDVSEVNANITISPPR